MIEGRRIWDVDRVADRAWSRFELSDLIRFKGVWYCGFVEGELHRAHPLGRARIIRSADGQHWESVALLDWAGAGVREPRFSVTAEGHLMVNTSIYFVSKAPRIEGPTEAGERSYTPTDARDWRDRSQVYYQLDSPAVPLTDTEAEGVARQSLTWLSSDGETWSSAYACPTGVNLWRWEVTWHKGMGYSVGKEGRGTLYRTRDGKHWRVMRSDFGPDGVCNEASIAFGADDTAYCLLRDGRLRENSPKGALLPDGTPAPAGTSVPLLGVGTPPSYQDWTWRNLHVDWDGDGQTRPAADAFRAPLGGPKLVRLSDGRLIAAGRMRGLGCDDGRITLFQVDPKQAVLTGFAECNGTTYGGVVEHAGMLWVSFCRPNEGVFVGRTPLPA